MTAPPAVAAFTRRWFDDLPEVYRAADEADPSVDGWPLLRYLSLLGDQADELSTLVDRFALHDDGAGDWTSDLSNPATADAAWLPWLAQMAGIGLDVGSGSAETFLQLLVDYPTFAALAADNVTFTEVRRHAERVPGGAGPDALRSALLDSTGARHAASTGAWERLIRPHLTGAGRVLHFRVFGGNPWALRLETYRSETPNPTLLGAIIATAARAAGLTVTYAARSGASFDEVTATFATFDTVEADFASFSALTAWLP